MAAPKGSDPRGTKARGLPDERATTMGNPGTFLGVENIDGVSMARYRAQPGTWLSASMKQQGYDKAFGPDTAYGAYRGFALAPNGQPLANPDRLSPGEEYLIPIPGQSVPGDKGKVGDRGTPPPLYEPGARPRQTDRAEPRPARPIQQPSVPDGPGKGGGKGTPRQFYDPSGRPLQADPLWWKLPVSPGGPTVDQPAPPKPTAEEWLGVKQPIDLAQQTQLKGLLRMFFQLVNPALWASEENIARTERMLDDIIPYRYPAGTEDDVRWLETYWGTIFDPLLFAGLGEEVPAAGMRAAILRVAEEEGIVGVQTMLRAAGRAPVAAAGTAPRAGMEAAGRLAAQETTWLDSQAARGLAPRGGAAGRADLSTAENMTRLAGRLGPRAAEALEEVRLATPRVKSVDRLELIRQSAERLRRVLAERAYLAALKRRFPRLASLKIEPIPRLQRPSSSGAPAWEFEERMRTSQGEFSYQIRDDKGRFLTELDGITPDGFVDEVKISQVDPEEVMAALRDKARFVELYDLKGVNADIGFKAPELAEEFEGLFAKEGFKNVNLTLAR